VSRASVAIGGVTKASIGVGLAVLLAVEETDTPEDIAWLSGKIARLRVFNDQEGVMNRSVLEAGGRVLVVSQFTLFASTRKGNRPSYSRAAPPESAVPLYEAFVAQLQTDLGQPVLTGEFGADMDVELVNQGPVTLIIDTRLKE
jgi:D-tyrosyl-tRNA(Tyr) deacylase